MGQQARANRGWAPVRSEDGRDRFSEDWWASGAGWMLGLCVGVLPVMLMWDWVAGFNRSNVGLVLVGLALAAALAGGWSHTPRTWFVAGLSGGLLGGFMVTGAFGEPITTGLVCTIAGGAVGWLLGGVGGVTHWGAICDRMTMCWWALVCPWVLYVLVAG